MEKSNNYKLLDHEVRLKRIEEALGLNIDLTPPKEETPQKQPQNEPYRKGREELFRRGFIKKEDEEKEKRLLQASDHLHYLIGTLEYDLIMNRVQSAIGRNQIKTTLIRYLNNTIYRELEKAKTTLRNEKKDSLQSP